MRKLTTYEGVVENGHVTLPPDAEIPEKDSSLRVGAGRGRTENIKGHESPFGPFGASQGFRIAGYRRRNRCRRMTTLSLTRQRRWQE